MKVFQINTVCGILSTGRICTDLAQVLEKEGHECKIAYGRKSVPSKFQKYAIRIGNTFTNVIDAGLSRIFDNSGLNSKIPTIRLIKKIKEFEPDIIQLHNLHGSYINIKILLKFLQEYGKHVVWTLHDCWNYTGHCTYFSTVDCEKWKTQCYDCPKKKAYPKSILLDRSARNYNLKKELLSSFDNLTFITPSKWLADITKQSFLGKYEIKVIPNGIDLQVFKPTESDFRQRYNLVDKKIVLGVASAWGKNKGFYDFIKLSEMLDKSYKVVMVGVTEEQKKLLPEEIIAITRTNNVTALAEIYTAADVFVNTTYSDNFPTVNLEAQACGTPAITYNSGGSPESVFDNLVVPTGDIDMLCEKIREVAENSDDTARVNALKNAGNYRKDDQYLKYLEEYKNVLSK